MPLTAELASLPFCCGETEGDKDLEDFFHHNALLYAQERLGKTYCFVNNEGEFSEIVAFFTVSNDSVKTTFIPKPSANKVQRTIPGQKHLRTYPAVLLGRLGVNKKYQGRNFLVGQQVQVSICHRRIRKSRTAFSGNISCLYQAHVLGFIAHPDFGMSYGLDDC